MHYIEIAVSVAERDAERACDALRAATGADPWIDVPFVQPDLESDAIPTADAMATVRAYLSGSDVDTRVNAARHALAAVGLSALIDLGAVAEEDWAESWKEFFDV